MQAIGSGTIAISVRHQVTIVVVNLRLLPK